MFGVQPKSRAGQLALEIYAELLAGVRAEDLTKKAVRRVGDILFVHDSAYDLQQFERVLVCGAGKAAASMASALVDILGNRLAGGLVITQPGGGMALPIETMVGAHPVPDERSVLAGDAMLEFAAQTTSRDLVLFCLSGGASAVMEAPVDGIQLTDLRFTTEVLLKSGADIRTLNAVRVRLSRIKGGGLARAFRARTVVLVVSDVLGNDLTVVGSGPFLAPRTRDHRGHAVSFDDRFPPAVRANLTNETILETPSVEHFVVGSAALLWPLASAAAEKRGLQPFGYADPIRGEARGMAGKIMRLAKTKRKRGEENFCMVLVGEATVTVHGDGRGGRAQEMATQAAGSLAAEKSLAFLAAGTDGADGPTDAAGGLVEQGSVAAARLAGVTARAALARSDSYHFLETAGGLIRTGPTGTNVNDVVLVVHSV